MFAGKRFGRYDNLSKIGEGGMGEIYSAHDPELDRAVAIKVLPAEFTADKDRKTRFRQEARAASALNHPNIITIFEIGDNEHGSFLATELVEGRTLREMIKRESPTLIATLKIIEQVAHALVAAHEANIIHRDIKPENIMVRRDSIVKVLDFGLAKPIFRDSDDADHAKTIPGLVMGSATYMSPEQARGVDVDERTDIWSVGVVLYEMLTGVTPFKESTTSETIAAVIYKEPKPLKDFVPTLPDELNDIVHKALSKNVVDRYASMRELADEIGTVIYDLEHSISGERAHHLPAYSSDENPTKIHRTDSSSHRTQFHRNDTNGIVAAGGRTNDRGFVKRAAAVVAGILITAALSFGIYSWLGAEEPLAANAFLRPQISRIATDGKVELGDISPDGKYVAYINGESGDRSLVVRQVSTDSVVTVVPPTNLNLASVKFSPEGDFIYYLQTSSDNVVNTLYKVPKLGGTPKKLIEDVDSAVTFSPDGKQFAFIRHTSTTNEDLIFVTDAETLESEQVLASGATKYSFFGKSLAWSPSGGSILIGTGKRQGGFVVGMNVAAFSLAERSLHTMLASEFYTVLDIEWFIDGSGYLFTARENQNDPVQIFRAMYPDNTVTPVTNDFNDYPEIGLSHDGRSIVTIKKDASSAIWQYNPQSGANVQLTGESRDLEGLYGLDQAPDGSVVFTRRSNGSVAILSKAPENKEAAELASDDGYSINPNVTADGKYVVFNLQKDKVSSIWRMNADGTNRIPLTEPGPETVDLMPQITSDGQAIIFQRQNLKENHGMLMKVPITGGTAEMLFSEEGKSVHNPRLSPDGKQIAFVVYDVVSLNKKIRIAEYTGDKVGKEIALLESNLIEQYQWSPDSKSLTVLTTRGGVPNIWREPIDGKPAEPISDFRSGRIFNFAWCEDGTDLLIVRGNTINDLILINDLAVPGEGDTATKRQRVRRAARLA